MKNESLGKFGKLMGPDNTNWGTINTDYKSGNIESGKQPEPVGTAPDRSIDCDYTDTAYKK